MEPGYQLTKMAADAMHYTINFREHLFILLPLLYKGEFTTNKSFSEENCIVVWYLHRQTTVLKLLRFGAPDVNNVSLYGNSWLDTLFIYTLF